MLCDSILDLIGHTPCVKLNHIDTKGADHQRTAPPCI